MPDFKPRHFEYILVLTAFAAGAVDVISFVRLGGVFVSAMTGNLAFLALYIATASFYSAIGSLTALAGFVIGAASGTLLTRGRPDRQAITFLLASETILLLGATVLRVYIAHREHRLSADALVLILAIAMGLQGIIGKKINLSSIPTVVFTSTLTNIVTAVTEAVASGQFNLTSDTRRQIVSFCLYFFGAIVAGLLGFFKFDNIVFVPLAGIALALVIHVRFRRHT